jgi:hypothetical protein
MRKFWLILGVLIFIDIAYFSFINKGQVLSFSYSPFIDSFSLDSGCSYLLLGLYGALGAYLIGYWHSSSLNDKIKKQNRNVEKSSIESQESSDRVKVLEGKIETLEKALQEALKK